MSKFAEKIFQGEVPTDADWAEHLIEAHRISPSMTPNGFAAHTTKDGRNSYQILADSFDTLPSRDATVIDLACGDGYLAQYLLPKVGKQGRIIGVDMSEGELAVARKTYQDSRIQFHCAKAQALPVVDRSIDCVFSHMAFMLMLPVEPVVKELARVLKPKGKFIAVVGNRKAQQDLFGEIQKVTFQFMDSQWPSSDRHDQA